jgi:exonuclease VII small subunit
MKTKLDTEKTYLLAFPVNSNTMTYMDYIDYEQRVAAELESKGLKLMRPIAIFPKGIDVENYIEQTLKMATVVDAILMPKGWNNRVECLYIYEFAKKNNIKAFEIEQSL